MFWRSKKNAPAQPAQEGAATNAPTAEKGAASTNDRVELDAALESVAMMLRSRARYAFSIGEEDVRTVASTFEKWASHLLVRTPPPTSSLVDSEPPRASNQPTRDWRGLNAFIHERSKREQVWVQGSVRDMRETIFSLVDSIRRTSYAQGKQDVVLRQRLAGLNVAVESGSLDALKREARLVAAAVTEVLEEQQRSVESQTEALRAKLAMLGQELEATRREGETDPLTKLANRRLLDVTLERALTVASVMERPLTLMMIDVDHFKAINDTHGHVMGDRVLCALGDTLSRAFPRRSDLVARYGGEEFAIVLPDANESDTRMLAERLLAAVRSMRIALDGGRMLSLTVSVGFAASLPGEAAVDLCQRADRALYVAKSAGRDRYAQASAELDTIAPLERHAESSGDKESGTRPAVVTRKQHAA